MTVWEGNFSSFGFVKRWFLCLAKPNVLKCGRIILSFVCPFKVCTVGCHSLAGNICINECLLRKTSQISTNYEYLLIKNK